MGVDLVSIICINEHVLKKLLNFIEICANPTSLPHTYEIITHNMNTNTHLPELQEKDE